LHALYLTLRDRLLSYKKSWQLLLAFAYLTITGCGLDDLSNKSARVSKDTSERILYLGKEEQATLTRQNAIPFLNTAYELIETSFDLSSSLSYQMQPQFLISSSGNNGEVNCSEGSLDVIDTRSRTTGTGDVVLDYNECVIGSTQIDGRLNYKVKVSSDGYSQSFELIINRLAIKDDEETITMTGDITDVFMGSLLVKNFIVHSKVQDSTFMASNLNFNNGDVSGEIYHSRFGWVDLASEVNPKSIVLSGANDSQLTSAYDSFTYTSTEDDAIFDIAFKSNDSLEQEALTTQISVANLYEWPYQENVPAISTTDPVLKGDRLSAIDLTATATDENSDFLSYQWTHIASPAQCQYELGETVADTASFTSQCKGVHTLELTIFDGFNTTSTNVDVDVIPLPGSITQVNDIKLTAGESLDVVVTPLYDAADGPFNFSLGYAPTGIVMDDSGRLSGAPILFTENADDEFKISIISENGRTSSSTITVNIDYPEPKRSLMANSSGCYTTKVWHDINGNGKPNTICRVNHSYMLVELDGNNFREIYTELTPPSLTELKSLTHSDINDDDINEIILGYEEEIFIIDGETKQVIKKIDIEFEYNVSYKILPLQSSYAGLFINTASYVTGVYLITFNENEDVTSNLDIHLYTNVKVGNLDDDPEPEIHFGDQILNFDSDPIETQIGVSHIADIDDDGVDELISLVRTGSSGNEFSLEVVDSRSLNSTVKQILSMPDTSTGMFDSLAFIVNVDDDKEKEIILSLRSSNKIFIFQYDGNNFVFDKEIVTPVPVNYNYNYNYNYSSIVQLGSNKVKAFLRYDDLAYSFSIYDGFSPMNDLTASPLINRFNNGNFTLSNPVIKDGLVETLFSKKSKLGHVKLDSMGEISDLNLTEIPAPYNLGTAMLVDVTGSNQNEVMLSLTSDNGYQAYNLDNNDLVLETTFETVLDSDVSVIKADINNDGKEDFLSYGTKNDAINWFDPVTDEEFWSFQLGNYSMGAGLPIVSDFDKNGITDIIVTLDSPDQGVELHVLSHDGESIKSRFVKTIDEDDFPFGHVNYGLQDVDNDGKQEIILVSDNCAVAAGITILILDDDLSILSEAKTDACIRSIPTIDSNSPKRNLIASSQVSDLRGPSQSRDAYSQFLEIDIFTGKEIWHSSPFFGEIKPDSLVFFDDDQNTPRKAAVFSSGLYTFR